MLWGVTTTTQLPCCTLNWDRGSSSTVYFGGCDLPLCWQDHNFVQPNNKMSVRDVGVMLFLDKVIRHPSVRSRVQAVLCAVLS